MGIIFETSEKTDEYYYTEYDENLSESGDYYYEYEEGAGGGTGEGEEQQKWRKNDLILTNTKTVMYSSKFRQQIVGC